MVYYIFCICLISLHDNCLLMGFNRANLHIQRLFQEVTRQRERLYTRLMTSWHDS